MRGLKNRGWIVAYWLIKTEPSDYSFAQLLREKKTRWTGVKNALARIHLKAMHTGDELLVYHTGNEKAVVGIARVEKADPETGEPTFAAVGALPRPVTLSEIKADRRFGDWGLVKIGRLSVVPTTAAQFAAIQRMASTAAE